jgi:hypothetical protein
MPAARHGTADKSRSNDFCQLLVINGRRHARKTDIGTG